ncbi:lysophospholipid acyltransferase family protein [Alkalimarinus coralli]|uniref:lysophospholipid acyltransferase family protein n=1 Tax=Alkalimarinus coralli TaxID=2935863 RepID=UPI00202B662A|nr:lysophospholipid acyltransferase family protein [Alkalimarinus coralli]
MAKKNKFRPVWHPALWPTWIVVFILFCISLLPLSTKLSLGEKLGKLLHKKLKSRAKVTRKNIAACFPELSDEEQARLIEDTFISCSKGFMETTHVWWRDVQPMVDNLTIIGHEHLLEAQKRGKGILLLSGHFTIFDLALPLIGSQLHKPGYMYRPNDNPVIDRMIEKGRRRHCDIQGFSKRNLRGMIKYIKEGGSVWYAADQDFGRHSTEFVDFFGVNTACISAPSWIARETDASVLVVSQFRLPNGKYEIAFSPILENFGKDDAKDAQEWNAYLEAEIRRHPDQYLWLHKRFKTRKPGDDPIY